MTRRTNRSSSANKIYIFMLNKMSGYVGTFYNIRR